MIRLVRNKTQSDGNDESHEAEHKFEKEFEDIPQYSHMSIILKFHLRQVPEQNGRETTSTLSESGIS